MLATHYRIVSALIIREMSTRFGNKPGGYLWAILDPLCHIGFLSFIFMGLARHPPLGKSFILFFATGFLGFRFYQSAVGYLTSAVSSNRALLSYPNVAPIDTVLARCILQFATNAVVSFAVLLPIVENLDQPIEVDWLVLLEGAASASALALGVAFANIVLFNRYPLYEKLFEIISRPLFMMSGVFFLPDSLPPRVRNVILWNPLTDVTMAFRKAFYPEYRAVGYNPAYMCLFALVVLVIGLAVFTSSRAVLRGR